MQHTSGIYNFSNIRYAQPPTGELRFQAPQSPKTDRTILTGEDGHICYQATPNWFASGPGVIPQLLGGKINSTYVNAPEHATPLSPAHVPLPIPHESEDCLFLDVRVPEKTFFDRNNSDGAAVIVWIYGGGLTMGWKDAQYDPAGLLAQSMLQTGKEVIFVALNYRVSLSSWKNHSILLIRRSWALLGGREDHLYNLIAPQTLVSSTNVLLSSRSNRISNHSEEIQRR